MHTSRGKYAAACLLKCALCGFRKCSAASDAPDSRTILTQVVAIRRSRSRSDGFARLLPRPTPDASMFFGILLIVTWIILLLRYPARALPISAAALVGR